jgi:hypothetical protein
MPFFSKPAGGPDPVGGVFPWTQVATCRNRTGGTLTKGEVVMLAFGAGNHDATEIATNDSNSYRPGASNDTIWNTVVDPQSNAITNGAVGTLTGAIWGVCLTETVADDAIGEFQFFGVVEKAYVVDAASGDGARPGQILGVHTASSNAFTCHVNSNRVVVGFYIDAQDSTLTNRALKRVFLTQGLGCARAAQQIS